MGSYKNFQTKSAKHTRNRHDKNEPEFVSHVAVSDPTQDDRFLKNINKFRDFVSWGRFYPDLFYDLITPESGGIKLDLDQRILLRAITRFTSTYGVFPRGWSKTLIEVMGLYHTAIFYPDIELSMTAQTKENAAKLLEEKHRELMRFYPLLKEEILVAKFSKDSAEVIFTSGGRIDVLANAQSTKGARRRRLNIEEAAQVDAELFEDVLEPVVNIPRRTIGKKSLVNPEEMNGQINFFTTSWFRGTSEYERNLKMYRDMINLKGVMVLGADWQLAHSYGRGETKAQILAKKERLSPTYFALNYESKWVGASSGALIDIKKMMDLRTITKPEYKSDGKSEYVLGMDVARSESDSNNHSSIAVFKLSRSKNGRIKNIRLVNLINLPNGLRFDEQTLELKRIRKAFNAKVVVIDGNGLGSAIIDEALKETFDPQTGENLGCWATINTDKEPEVKDAEEIIYDFNPQAHNSDMIINFIDMVESKKLLLLEKIDNANYDINSDEEVKKIAPYLQTDILLAEVANLRLVEKSNRKYSVEQVVRKINKDRYSAVAMGLWYIKNFEDNSESTSEYEFGFFFN